MASKKSPWLWVGVGCLAFFIAGSLCIVGSCVWMGRWASEMEASFKDPEKRRDAVYEALGTDELPPGYYPGMAFNIPFIMKTAIISTEPIEDPDEMAHSMDADGAMVFIELIRMGQDRDEIRRYVTGETDNARVLSENGIHVDVDEILDRGVAPIEGGELMYVTAEGSMSAPGAAGQGLLAIVMIDCGDARGRMAVWKTPSEEQTKAAGLGSAANPDDLQQFMSHFSFCS